jgi:hypothetical protein
MPRYSFHLVEDRHVILDDRGVELEELSAAHAYGVKLQRQIRQYAPEQPCKWAVRIAYEDGAIPLVILPQRQHWPKPHQSLTPCQNFAPEGHASGASFSRAWGETGMGVPP